MHRLQVIARRKLDRNSNATILGYRIGLSIGVRTQDGDDKRRRRQDSGVHGLDS